MGNQRHSPKATQLFTREWGTESMPFDTKAKSAIWSESYHITKNVMIAEEITCVSINTAPLTCFLSEALSCITVFPHPTPNPLLFVIPKDRKALL